MNGTAAPARGTGATQSAASFFGEDDRRLHALEFFGRDLTGDPVAGAEPANRDLLLVADLADLARAARLERSPAAEHLRRSLTTALP